MAYSVGFSRYGVSARTGNTPCPSTQGGLTRPMGGKVALITGGSSGIGRAAALAFAHAGARVVLANSCNVAAGAAVVQLIHERGGQALFVQTDVTQSGAVAALVAQTVERFGGLDYAFNNAGVGGGPASVVDTEEAAWDIVIDVNLKGVWQCMKYEIPAMLRHGGGAIVNTASAGGLVGTPGLGAYTASKHGVVGLTKVAALEYARAGIRVNAVCPGLIRTPMVEQAFLLNHGFAEMMIARHPVGRIGTPEEVAAAVVWLCSDAAAFVTGTALPIDGGAVAQEAAHEVKGVDLFAPLRNVRGLLDFRPQSITNWRAFKHTARKG